MMAFLMVILPPAMASADYKTYTIARSALATLVMTTLAAK